MEDLKQQGLAALDSEDFDLAKACFERMLELEPDNLETKLEIARCLCGQEKNDEALSILFELKNTISEEALPVDVFYLLGILYDKMAEFQKNNEYLLISTQYMGQYIELESHFGKDYRKQHDIHILKTLAEAYEKLQKYDEAKKCYCKILDFDPQNVNSKVKMAWNHYFQKKYSEALTLLIELETSFSEESLSDTVFYLLGRIYDKKGHEKQDDLFLKKAIDYLEKYLLLNPASNVNLYWAYRILGTLYCEFDNDLLSAKFFENALSIYNQCFLDWISLAKTYQNLNEYDKAIQALLESNRLRENQDAYFYLSFCFYCKNNFKETIKYAEKAILLNPKEPAPYQMLALVYFQQAAFDKALSHIRKALDLKNNARIDFPGNFAILGRLLKEKGYSEMANECFEAL